MPNDITTQQAFDYSALDAATRSDVERCTAAIKERRENMRRDFMAICTSLRDVKRQLQHGQWGRWLRAEFDWSEDTAERMLKVAALGEQNPQFAEFQDQFAQSALYLLAAASTPDALRQQFAERAAAGEMITHEMVKAALHTDDELTADESTQLRQIEGTMEATLSGMREAVKALRAIHDGNLYRANYRTFEDYCQAKYGMSRRFAYQLLACETDADILALIVEREGQFAIG